MIIVLSLLASVCLLLFALAKRGKRNLRMPPGPRGFPLLGNLLQLGTRPHLKLAQWAEEHGKLFTIHIGNKPALVLNDIQLIKKIFETKASNERIKSDLFAEVTWKRPYGIGSTDFNTWQEQKRFFLRALKEFGFHRASRVEPLVLDEAARVCTWIDGELFAGRSVITFDEILKHASGNVVWTMVAGEKATTCSTDIVILVSEWVSTLQLVIKSGLLLFPWIRHLAPVTSGYTRYMGLCSKLRDYVQNCFTQHRISRAYGESPRDMIDAYIDKVELCQDPKSSFYGDEGWKHCYSSVLVLLIAGRDSTGMILNWLIFYMAVYPDVQEKLQQEIGLVLGRDGDTRLEHRSKLRYTEVVILETLRFATVTALGTFRQLSENIEFQGYQLPKGLILMPNLYFVHNDKTIWGDPERFRPERFLEDGGNRLKEYVASFQPGKRSCPGERFARDVLFLVVPKLFQRYVFHVDDNAGRGAHEYLTCQRGFFIFPKKLGVRVFRRHQ